MRKNNIPVTKRRYPELAFLGDDRLDGHELDAEDESMLPPGIQKTPKTCRKSRRRESGTLN
ncbi:MAG: hypothetical protein LAO19_07180 [Acidobacteriia bacterium]|nr:hypothetical protein [Terriglobia bacterium]